MTWHIFNVSNIPEMMPPFSEFVERLPALAQTAFRYCDCDSWDKLLSMTSNDLLSIRNVGMTTLTKVRNALKQLGLSLKDD